MNSLPLSESTPKKRKRQIEANLMDRGLHPFLVLAPDGQTFRPTTGDIHGTQGVQIKTVNTLSTMGYQIDFQIAGLISPANRQRTAPGSIFEQRPRPGGTERLGSSSFEKA